VGGAIQLAEEMRCRRVMQRKQKKGESSAKVAQGGGGAVWAGKSERYKVPKKVSSHVKMKESALGKGKKTKRLQKGGLGNRKYKQKTICMSTHKKHTPFTEEGKKGRKEKKKSKSE